MKNIILTFLFLLSSFNVLISQTYITNVTIADVENYKMITNQTVVITNGIITEIKKSKKIKIPSKAIVIDGTGKYLFPGLTDAHIHFFQNGGLYTRPDAIDLRKSRPHQKEMDYAHQNMEKVMQRYLQNGITNVIDVGANYHFLEQRNQFKNRKHAPSVYMTGPLLTTYEPSVFENLENEEPFSLTKTVEEGINMVRKQLPYHPDLSLDQRGYNLLNNYKYNSKSDTDSLTTDIVQFSLSSYMK